MSARANSSGRLAFSICIPAYGVVRETLQATVDSAFRQLPKDSELILLSNGPEAIEITSQLQLPSEVVVAPSLETIDVVPNWNRCLTLSRGDLIHILHADDLVAPGFYEAIADLAQRFPQAALYATAAADLDGDSVLRRGSASTEPTLLSGWAAAKFLLDDPRHACGNVVLTRGVVVRQGPFREQFRFCPDEEAFLRYAADASIAFDPRPLYLQRRHEGQMRSSAWREPDFVAVYVESRLSGARNFGGEVERFARGSTLRRVTSTAVTMALAGEQSVAARILEDIPKCLPEARRSLRLRAARVALARPLRPLVIVRRRVLGFASPPSPPPFR